MTRGLRPLGFVRTARLRRDAASAAGRIPGLGRRCWPQVLAVRAAHTLRGEGTSHGYPLVSGVAASLCRVLERGHARHRAGWPMIDAHLATLDAILRENLTAGGGAAGHALLLALRDRVEEGTAPMRAVGLLPPHR